MNSLFFFLSSFEHFVFNSIICANPFIFIILVVFLYTAALGMKLLKSPFNGTFDVRFTALESQANVFKELLNNFEILIFFSSIFYFLNLINQGFFTLLNLILFVYIVITIFNFLSNLFYILPFLKHFLLEKIFGLCEVLRFLFSTVLLKAKQLHFSFTYFFLRWHGIVFLMFYLSVQTFFFLDININEITVNLCLFLKVSIIMVVFAIIFWSLGSLGRLVFLSIFSSSTKKAFCLKTPLVNTLPAVEAEASSVVEQVCSLYFNAAQAPSAEEGAAQAGIPKNRLSYLNAAQAPSAEEGAAQAGIFKVPNLDLTDLNDSSSFPGPGTKALFGNLGSKVPYGDQELLNLPVQDVQIYMFQHGRIGQYVGRVMRPNVNQRPNTPAVDEPNNVAENINIPNNLGEQGGAAHGMNENIPALFVRVAELWPGNLEGVVFAPRGIENLARYINDVGVEFRQVHPQQIEPFVDWFVNYLQQIGDQVNLFNMHPNRLIDTFRRIIDLLADLEQIAHRNFVVIFEPLRDADLVRNLQFQNFGYIGNALNHNYQRFNPLGLVNDAVAFLFERINHLPDRAILEFLLPFLHSNPVLAMIALFMVFHSLLGTINFFRLLGVFVLQMPEVIAGLIEALTPAPFVRFRNIPDFGHINVHGMFNAIRGLLTTGASLVILQAAYEGRLGNRPPAVQNFWFVVINPAIEPVPVPGPSITIRLDFFLRLFQIFKRR